MRVWDSELLAAKKPVEMVTDGLIMWIDGRDAPSNYALHERVTNTNISPNSRTNYTTSQTSDGLFTKFATTGSAYAAYYFNGSAAKTVEFVVSPLTLYAYAVDAGNSELMYVSRNYSTAPFVRATYRVAGTGIYVYPDSFPQHYVIRPHSAMINGVKTEEQGTITTAFAYAKRINSWSAHDEVIGAIRAYNRELTDDEILQNLEYEKSIGRVVL